MSASLVTGAFGCVGAWVSALLAGAGERVVAHDLGADPPRLHLVPDADSLERISFVHGDVTDLAGLERVLADHDVTSVIHLAGLQAPYCAADPVSGAQVNVVG